MRMTHLPPLAFLLLTFFFSPAFAGEVEEETMGEPTITLMALKMNGDREEVPFHGFSGECAAYGKEGIILSGNSVPMSAIAYLVPRGGGGRFSDGRRFGSDTLKPAACRDGFVISSQLKTMTMPGFKKDITFREKIMIPLKEIDVLAADARGLSEGLEASKSMITEEMVFVKGGCFRMGDFHGKGGSDEIPAHEVCLGDFFIGRFEVTQRQWWEVTGNTPSRFRSCDRCPIEEVTWNDAAAFLQKLNLMKGTSYRLPTEAEWEYAARSGGKDEVVAGSGDQGAAADFAWYGPNGGSKTHPVGEKSPNGLGIHDMSGNVAEWVSDWYGEGYYGASPKDSPAGPLTGSFRGFRGGSFYLEPAFVRTTARLSAPPEFRDRTIGFRLALTPDSAAQQKK